MGRHDWDVRSSAGWMGSLFLAVVLLPLVGILQVASGRELPVEAAPWVAVSDELIGHLKRMTGILGTVVDEDSAFRAGSSLEQLAENQLKPLVERARQLGAAPEELRQPLREAYREEFEKFRRDLGASLAAIQRRDPALKAIIDPGLGMVSRQLERMPGHE